MDIEGEETEENVVSLELGGNAGSGGDMRSGQLKHEATEERNHVSMLPDLNKDRTRIMQPLELLLTRGVINMTPSHVKVIKSLVQEGEKCEIFQTPCPHVQKMYAQAKMLIRDYISN